MRHFRLLERRASAPLFVAGGSYLGAPSARCRHSVRRRRLPGRLRGRLRELQQALRLTRVYLQLRIMASGLARQIQHLHHRLGRLYVTKAARRW